LCRKCHGDTRDDCDECRNSEINNLDEKIESTCNCKVGYFDDNTQTIKSKYCQPCNVFCSRCDITSDNCSSCIDNPGVISNNYKCECIAPSYFVYYNSTVQIDQCVKCHPLCTKCNGPLNSQCDFCDTEIGGIFKSPSTCMCKFHYYYEPSDASCAICDGLCLECSGPTSSQCLSCDLSKGFSVSNSANLCVYDCSALDGYFTSGRTCFCIFQTIIKSQK